MGMSINRVPQNGWFIRENPNLKWMITRGTPIYGNPHINISRRDVTMVYGNWMGGTISD